MSTAHPNSWYYISRNRDTAYAPLTGEKTADVCVIGGGVTGLSAALNLKQRGYKTVVLEAGRIGCGASGRNGGQMIIGYSCDAHKLQRIVGKAHAKRFWDMSVESIGYTKQLIEENQIECGLTGGHIEAAIKRSHMEDIAASERLLRDEYGYTRVEVLNTRAMRERVNSSYYIGGMYSPDSAHLHPLNYTLGLAAAAEKAGAEIYENTEAISVSKGKPIEIYTGKGKITCRYLILAGNAYLKGIFPQLRSRIMPVGTYMIATAPLGRDLAADTIRDSSCVADMNFVLDYYRLSQDDRMLYGGRVSYSTLEPLSIKASIGRRMEFVFPQLKNVPLEYAWGGFVAITVNRFPHFGRLRDDIYYAQGFSGHGVSLTGFAGKLMADAVAKTSEEFDMFSQIRHMPFPGGKWFRMPALVLSMLYFRMRDRLAR